MIFSPLFSSLTFGHYINLTFNLTGIFVSVLKDKWYQKQYVYQLQQKNERKKVCLIPSSIVG